MVSDHSGETLGYTTSLADLQGHTVARSPDALDALLAAASAQAAITMLVPLRSQPQVYSRCLAGGLRTSKICTLLVKGAAAPSAVGMCYLGALYNP